MVMESESRITVGVEVEMRLKKVIAESREIAQALNEFANTLEQIERKYEDIDDGNIEREEEQKQKADEIRVGDEVMVNDIDRKAIVIGISTFEDWDAPYNILFENGNTGWVRKDIISKTGKHYDAIDEVLKELRGDEE